MAKQKQKINLKKQVAKLDHSPLMVDSPKIISGEFESNPFKTYAGLLEDYYSYKQYSANQEFLAVVLQEIIVADAYQNLPEYIQANFESTVQQKIFRIVIPPLDSHLPIFDTDSLSTSLKLFLNDISRYAICEDKKQDSTIKVGSIVRISDAIVAARLRKPCIIRSVLPLESIDVEEAKKKLLDAYEKCIPKLALRPPPEKVKTEPAKTTAIKPVFSKESEIRSKVDQPENSPAINRNVEKTKESPAPVDAEKQKTETIKETMPSADDLKAACDLGPTQSPQKTDKTADEKINENCFVRNGKTLPITQEIKDLGKAGFFNSLSAKTGKKVLTASKTLDSIGPVYEYPEDLRDPRMIVIKTVQYTFANDYFEKIQSDKLAAAHFCIDLNGDIYQFTDTKNLVKSYNPIIDEKAIYIAVVNIPFRNSVSTLNKKQFRVLSNSPFSFNNIGRQAELAASVLSDKTFLKRFYSRKGAEKEDIADKQSIIDGSRSGRTIDTFKLDDGRDTFPDYRLDYTELQKKSIVKLTRALCVSYGIPLDFNSFPKTYGFDPEVAAGDFIGIVCPFHFSLTEMEPLNFYDFSFRIIDNI